MRTARVVLVVAVLAARLVLPAGVVRFGARQHKAASGEVFPGCRETFGQARADALAGHLDEPERGHFRYLVFGAVAAQAFDQATNHEVAVGFKHHVDEVNDDDAANIAQTQLADDFFGCFEVILRDGLFEGSAGAGELAGVDVDDGHRLCAVDDERTT